MAPACPFRRLSQTEQLERHRQGLCYNCDEPYVRGHVCQRLFYLEAADFLDDDIPAEVAAVAAFPEEAAILAPAPAAGQEPTAQPQVSLYTIAGIRTENVMLLPVFVHGHRLVALLDSSSTHNFINADLLRCLHLSTAPHPTMRVLVANGDRVPCKGVARDVALAIGTEEFTISCYGISLGGFDLILGIEFLRTLGPILWDFKDLCIAFTQGTRHILWKGLGSPTTTSGNRQHGQSLLPPRSHYWTSY